MAKLKICGLTCKEDIEAVNGAKPDFAGFIIEVPGRRRSLTAERVKVLVKGLDKEILPVGVFVNASDLRVPGTPHFLIKRWHPMGSPASRG